MCSANCECHFQDVTEEEDGLESFSIMIPELLSAPLQSGCQVNEMNHLVGQKTNTTTRRLDPEIKADPGDGSVS